MKNKFAVAQKVATLVESIEVIDEKLEQIVGFATTLIEQNIEHMDLSLEECDINNPAKVQYLYPQVNPGEVSPDQEVLPIGYSKVFQGAPGAAIHIWSSIIPKDVCLAVVDTMVSRLQEEKTGYQNTLDELMPDAPKEKTYNYSVEVPKNPA